MMKGYPCLQDGKVRCFERDVALEILKFAAVRDV